MNMCVLTYNVGLSRSPIGAIFLKLINRHCARRRAGRENKAELTVQFPFCLVCWGLLCWHLLIILSHNSLSQTYPTKMAAWGLKKDVIMGGGGAAGAEDGPAVKKKKAGGGAAAAAVKPGDKRKLREAGGAPAAPKKDGAKDIKKGYPHPPRYKDLVGQTVENSRNIAFLMSVVFYTVLLPKASTFVQSALSIGKQYYEATLGKKDHKMGSPHLHVFNSLVAELKNLDMESDDSWPLDQFLDADEGQGRSLDSLEEVIQVCRVTRTFNQEIYKIMFNGHPKVDGVIQLLLRCMEHEGGEIKRSVAPKGPRERRLEEYLRKGPKDDNEDE